MGKAKAPHGGPGPQYMLVKTGGVSPLNRAPVLTGVRLTSGGGLFVMQLTGNMPHGRAIVMGQSLTGVAPKAVAPSSLIPPPGLPTRPPPGFASSNHAEKVTQAVMGQVQAMFERFTELFERRLAQRWSGSTGSLKVSSARP